LVFHANHEFFQLCIKNISFWALAKLSRTSCQFITNITHFSLLQMCTFTLVFIIEISMKIISGQNCLYLGWTSHLCQKRFFIILIKMTKAINSCENIN